MSTSQPTFQYEQFWGLPQSVSYSSALEPRQTLTRDISTDLTLISGVGSYKDKQGCIMSAANARWHFLKGFSLGNATDKLICVSPVIRSLAISVNDHTWWGDIPQPTADEERTKVLMPYVDKILDTKKHSDLEVSRALRCVDFNIRTLVPLDLRTIRPDETSLEAAEKLEKLGPINNPRTAQRASELLNITAAYRYATGNYSIDFSTLTEQAAAFFNGNRRHFDGTIENSAVIVARDANIIYQRTGNKLPRDLSLDLLSELCEMH